MFKKTKLRYVSKLPKARNAYVIDDFISVLMKTGIKKRVIEAVPLLIPFVLDKAARVRC